MASKARRRLHLAALAGAAALGFCSLRRCGEAFARKTPQGRQVKEYSSDLYPLPYPPKYDPNRKQETAKTAMMKDYLRELKIAEDEGAWEEAMELFESMKTRELERSPTYWAAVIGAHARKGLWERAFQVLGMMDRERAAPDHVCFNNAILACEEDGNVEQAQKMVQQMTMRGMAPQAETFARVIKILMQQEKFKEARSYYEEAQKIGVFNLWLNKGTVLDLRDCSIEVTELLTRMTVEDRAWMASTGRKMPGFAGFKILVGPASKDTNFKQRAVAKIMRQEYGLKILVEPPKMGRIRVRSRELTKLGLERRAEEGMNMEERKARREERRRKREEMLESREAGEEGDDDYL